MTIQQFTVKTDAPRQDAGATYAVGQDWPGAVNENGYVRAIREDDGHLIPLPYVTHGALHIRVRRIALNHIDPDSIVRDDS